MLKIVQENKTIASNQNNDYQTQGQRLLTSRNLNEKPKNANAKIKRAETSLFQKNLLANISKFKQSQNIYFYSTLNCPFSTSKVPQLHPIQRSISRSPKKHQCANVERHNSPQLVRPQLKKSKKSRKKQSIYKTNDQFVFKKSTRTLQEQKQEFGLPQEMKVLRFDFDKLENNQNEKKEEIEEIDEQKKIIQKGFNMLSKNRIAEFLIKQLILENIKEELNHPQIEFLKITKSQNKGKIQ